MNSKKKIKFTLRKELSLRKRLLILIISLLAISVIAVGISSYTIAKNTTVEAIEKRLLSEVDLTSQIADNLKFMYISDEDYFWQQLEINVRSQQTKLENDGITSDYFYITDNTTIPFQISEDSLVDIPESLVSEILEQQNGILHQSVNGEDYTLSFSDISSW